MNTRLLRQFAPQGLHYRAYTTLSERLRNDLTTRKLPMSFDYLQPQPSHLLNLTLHDALPQLVKEKTINPSLPSVKKPIPLPAGHHLIYFPPQVTLSQLLPDGTDVLHTPGKPFNRRLWAGGNVKFPKTDTELLLDGSRAVCIESIRNVAVKGRDGEEKVIVTIERRVGKASEDETEGQTYHRIWKKEEADLGDSSLVENRDLIFMRAKTDEQIKMDKAEFAKPGRIVRAPSDATFRHSMLPTKSLLFRFSALTFNAHSIHLDQSYTRDQEGYRNLLVHGPLTLTLLLSVLQRQLRSLHLQVQGIEYKNLAPLFVDEELTVCGKPKNDTTWDVWIEGPGGGLSVRGTAKTAISALP